MSRRRTNDETNHQEYMDNLLVIIAWYVLTIREMLAELYENRVEAAINIGHNALAEAEHKQKRVQREYWDECVTPFRKTG